MTAAQTAGQTAGVQAAADTVFALSSARGRAGVAVIRLSGPRAGMALEALTAAPPPPPRLARLTTVVDPASGDRLDRGLVLWFPAPASVTGQDVAELHVHGGRAVIAGVLDALSRIDGLRPAEPGEFTRRAFEHGKLDLTAAEGVADLIAAQTAAQRRQALRQMDGALGALYDRWRTALVGGLAHLEADIDFADEDLPGGVAEAVVPQVAEVRAEIARHLDDRHRGERLRDGLAVVILGPPNVGKSSLLNALSRSDAAIVSDIAGTTRDVIEVQMDLDGFAVRLIDTAGLRAAGDVIEAEGVRRARQRAADADLRLVLADAAAWPDMPADTRALITKDTFLVINKIDQHPDMTVGTSDTDALGVHPVSATTGAGLDALMAALATEIADRFDVGDAPGLTRARHRAALVDCVAHLDRFVAATGGGQGAHDPVLAAEDVRLATRALGRITGRVDVEDVLDVVFADFCIGK